MTYDRYYSIIKRIATLKKFVKKYIVVFTLLLLLLSSAVFALLYACGGFTSDMKCEDIVYGERVKVNAKAFLSTVKYEYAVRGSDVWTEEAPRMPGEYTVRAYTSNVFAGKRMQEADFSISKRNLIVRAEDANVMYGESSFSFKSEGLAYGDRITDVTYIAEKEPTEKGKVDIGTLKVVNSDGKDVSEAYDVELISGNLTVKKRSVILSVRDVSKEYDASPLHPTEWYIVMGSFADGDAARVTFSGEQTEIGSSKSVITSYAVFNSDGKDVSYCYDIHTKEGNVEVKKINIVIKTGSLTTEYDGTRKPCNTFEIEEGEFFGDDYLLYDSVKFFSAPIVAGEHPNRLESTDNIRIVSKKTGKDVSDRYSISVSEGTISISKRKITVKTQDITIEYNGMSLSDRGEVKVISGSLAASDSLVVLSFAGEIVNVGKIENKVEKLSIKNNTFGIDTTQSYEISYECGTVEVIKCKLVIKSPDLSKVYDGQPLVPEGGLVFLVGKLGMMDYISCTYHNMITDVGRKENLFDIKLSSENPAVVNVEGNYDITLQTGTLEVFARPIVLKSPVSVFKYDGKTHYTGDELYIYDGSIAYGHSTKVLTRSFIIDVGTTENIYTVDILDASGASVAKNYHISCMYGHLVVLPELAGGMGNIDIFGEPAPSYSIDVPSLSTPNTDPPNGNTEENNVIYNPPGPSNNNQGQQGGETPPVLPPVLQYPSVGGEDPNNDPSGTENPALFEIYTDKSHVLFLRGTSYGNYNGKSWEEGVPFLGSYMTKNPLLYASDKLKATPNFGAALYELKVRGTYDFYSTYFPESFPERMISDVSGKSDTSEYSLYFYDFEETRQLVYNSAAIENSEIDEYTEWVYANYLYIDSSLKKQLIEIAEANNVYKNSPTLISDVVYFLGETTKYNLNYAEYPEDSDTIIYFLTTAKEGICIHYAGAAALIYRAYGIPARVSVGYKCQSKAGEWTEIKAPAHAWVEVFINGAWYPVEATPAGSGSNLEIFEDDPILANQNVTPNLRPEIIIEFPSAHKYYDGKPLRAGAVKLSGGSLKNGHRLIAESSTSLTYVGSTQIAYDRVMIVDSDGNDVSDEYCIRIKEGTLTVRPIVPSAVQKVLYLNNGDTIDLMDSISIDLYNREEKRIVPLSEEILEGVKLLAHGYINCYPVGDMQYKITGNGYLEIVIYFKNYDANGDGAFEYVATQSKVMIELSSFLNVKYRNVTVKELAENASIDFSKKNTPVEYLSPEGKSFNYLALSPSSVKKAFDGTPLSSGECDILCGALLDGHRIVLGTKSSQLYVGDCANVCSRLSVVDANGNDVTYMYFIEVFHGILSVKESEVERVIGDVSIDKESVYDLDSVEWVSFVERYPISASVLEGERNAIVEDNKIIGIRHGDAVVSITFAALDLNFDGVCEYGNTTFTVNVSVNDPNLYKNAVVIILVAALSVLLSAAVVTLTVRFKRLRKVENTPSDAGEPRAQNEKSYRSEEEHPEQ